MRQFPEHRTMGCILSDKGSEFLSQRTFSSFCRVGGTHQITPFLDGAIGFQYHDYAGTAAHKSVSSPKKGRSL